MAVKDGSREDSGPSADTGIKGNRLDPELLDIQRKLDTDINLSGYGLKASFANNTLQVTGIVDTLEDKRSLKTLLSNMDVHSFTDAVSISTDGEVLDDDVVLEVREELEANPHLSGTGISVECTAGTVFLVGDVESRRQEELAVAAARKARGVVRVVSQLKFLPGDMDIESIFHSQVKNDGSSHWKD